ncbi:hypothetical protein DNTS_018769 [Danionella cerebrum]|uniref:RNA polymerase II-associated protein 3 n=1 Tax=Danionella cerebrum TaxID=2873325 RepID=A0A553PYD8_9TELE|nr:hypothetical protein DNTS_018769 [Danionella translucida]
MQSDRPVAMTLNKALDLQLQMRNNAEELQNFMRDLESWEDEMKRKDQQLRVESSGENSAEKTLPAVRNRDYKMKKKRRKRQADSSQKQQRETQRIKAYDYESWDKFDADKALESLDAAESPVQSNESDSEGLQADCETAYIQKQKIDSAISCLTRAMEADPVNPELPTIRAACFQSLRKFAVAESDCNLAIALDSKHVGAFLRRAEARSELSKHQEALEDYQSVLTLDPGNSEAQTQLLKLKQVLASRQQTEEENQSKSLQEQQRKQEAVVQKDNGNDHFKAGRFEAAVECYTKGMEADRMNALLPANRAMAFLKLHRFSEAEQDCCVALTLDPSYTKAFARRATARAALGNTEDARDDFMQVLKLEPGNKQALNELQKLSEEKQSNARLVPQEVAQRRTIRPIQKPEHLRSTKALRRMQIQEVTGASPQSTAQQMRSPEVKSSCENRSMFELRIPENRSLEEQDVPPPPSSSFQLEADLRKIRHHTQLTHTYLKSIPPDQYLQIFQTNLEPELMMQILQSFHHAQAPSSEELCILLEVLKNLSRVRRFDMAIMFMSSAEKKMVQDLFAQIEGAGLTDSSVQDLQKRYGL